MSVLRKLFGMPAHRHAHQTDGHWPEDTPIPPQHPLVPAAIRDAVARIAQDGDTLHRVQTHHGTEWWLLDIDGELVEAFLFDA